MSSYYTLKRKGAFETVVKGSRFVAVASHVCSLDDAKAFFKCEKGLHSDADHNVTAYVIGVDNCIQGHSDDGEPGGSAGAPIIGMLKGGGIVNAAIVVSRYFGGVKLGVGGLVRAYTTAAKGAIDDAGLAQLERRERVIVRIGYDALPMIENRLLSGDFPITKKRFEDGAELELLIRPGQLGELRSLLGQMSKGKASIDIIGEEYCQV